MQSTDRPLDLTAAIIAYESGELSDEQTTELFQALVNTGAVWHLQGRYGRTAIALLEAGRIQRPAAKATINRPPTPTEGAEKQRNRLVAELRLWETLAEVFTTGERVGPENRRGDMQVVVPLSDGEWDLSYGICGAIRQLARYHPTGEDASNRMRRTLMQDGVTLGGFSGYHWPLDSAGHDERGEFCKRMVHAVRVDLAALDRVTQLEGQL